MNITKRNRLTQTVVTRGRRKGEGQNMGGGLEVQTIIYIYIFLKATGYIV